MRTALLFLASLLMAGCSSEPKSVETPAPAKKAAPKPYDATRRFPAASQVEAKVVDEHLLGHEFLPGGNIAHYRKGKQEYDLILIRTSSPDAAALLLLDYKKKLENPKVIAHFGGFAGKDGSRPAFLFAKGVWLAGVIGLPEAEADMAAREFAARLD